jgi:citrate lyase beta subunit
MNNAERPIPTFDAGAAGVVQLDGVMLDAPHLTQARRIMAALEHR